jgi:hypothetical protein
MGRPGMVDRTALGPFFRGTYVEAAVVNGNEGDSHHKCRSCKRH